MAWRRHETRLFRHLTFNFSPILLNCNLDCKSHWKAVTLSVTGHSSQFCGALDWRVAPAGVNIWPMQMSLAQKSSQIRLNKLKIEIGSNPSKGHEFATMTQVCPVQCKVKCPLWVKVRDAVHWWGQRRAALVTEAAWPPAQWPSGDHCHCWALTLLH